MNRTKILCVALCEVALTFVFWVGCDYRGEPAINSNPYIRLYNSPPDSSIIGAAPIIWWWGTDRDGIIRNFEYIDIPKSLFGDTNAYRTYYSDTLSVIPETLILLDGKLIWWRSTQKNVDTIFLSLERGEDTTEHLFCIRSVDNDSAKSAHKCLILFRTNQSPDTVTISWDTTSFNPGDTLWMLTQPTKNWSGYTFTWTSHDPDGSVLMEYYWKVENVDNPAWVAKTSLADDANAGIYAGFDSLDGWVRMTYTTLYGIPTGRWRFILTARDDAFYPGTSDTFEFFAVQPYFDPTRPEFVDHFTSGQPTPPFPHRMLVIYASNGVLPADRWKPAIDTFYRAIFETMVQEGYIESFDTIMLGRTPSGEMLTIPATVLKEYSIIYLYDPEIASNAYHPLDDEFLQKIVAYTKIGGRVIFDGRNCFQNANPNPSAWDMSQFPSYSIFGVKTYKYGSTLKLKTATPTFAFASQLPTLVVDSTKFGNSLLDYANSIGIEIAYGVPYTEVIYTAGNYEGATPESRADLINLPIAVRRADHTFRSVYFTFPLFYMKNSNREVEEVLRFSFDFITKWFPPYEVSSSQSPWN